YRQAIGLDEKLGRPEGLASSYNNLAGVLAARNKLDLAENIVRKAIEMNARLGRTDGLAIAYKNLGRIRNAGGDSVAAREAWERSIHRFRAAGLAEEAARVEALCRPPSAAT